MTMCNDDGNGNDNDDGNYNDNYNEYDDRDLPSMQGNDDDEHDDDNDVDDDDNVEEKKMQSVRNVESLATLRFLSYFRVWCTPNLPPGPLLLDTPSRRHKLPAYLHILLFIYVYSRGTLAIITLPFYYLYDFHGQSHGMHCDGFVIRYCEGS